MRRALGLDSPAMPLGSTGWTGAAQPDTSARIRAHLPSLSSARPRNAPPPSELPLSLRQRLAALAHQLVEERTHHDQSRRQLEHVQHVLADLQARTQCVALDHADELAAERTASMQAQRELDDLLFERDQHRGASTVATMEQAAAEPRLAKRVKTPVTTPKPTTSAAVDNKSAHRRHGRPKQHAGALEPKPVRWWTASYRAEAKTKR